MATTRRTARENLWTRRLLLRDVVAQDAGLLFDLDSDPEVMRYIGASPASDVEPYRDRIRAVHVPQQSHPWQGIRLVLDRESDVFLGWVFARSATKSSIAREIGWTRCGEIEIGFRFRRFSWGRGYAIEAAGALLRVALADPATEAVVACAHAENAASLRVLQKLGLKRIGEVVMTGESWPTVKLAAVR